MVDREAVTASDPVIVGGLFTLIDAELSGETYRTADPANVDIESIAVLIKECQEAHAAFEGPKPSEEEMLEGLRAELTACGISPETVANAEAFAMNWRC